MALRSLQLTNFRNYSQIEIRDVSSGINLLIAPNGTGKSNLLEAIFINVWATSPRTHFLSETISWEENQSSIESVWEETTYRIFYTKDGKKFFVNQKPVDFHRFVNQRAVVFFQPNDLGLLHNTPNNRRRFINRMIAQVDISYLVNHQTYLKLLKQRNFLLREDFLDEDVLETIEMQLAAEGALIILYRVISLLYLNQLLENEGIKLEYQVKSSRMRELIREMMREISTQNGFSLIYKDIQHYGNYAEILREKMREILREMREKERELGFTLIGPQKDDFVTYLSDARSPSGWKNAGLYASRGEQRIIIVKLKVTEAELITNNLQQKPLLLLDDIFSELDLNNRELIIAAMQNYQVFVTGTEVFSEIPARFPQISRIDLTRLFG